MISKHCKKLKYKRKIVLVTDGYGAMEPDDVSQITEKIKADDIELVIMYVTPGSIKLTIVDISQRCRF